MKVKMKNNAPCRFFGGKGTMKSRIFKHFPNKKDFNMYIEPFSGSYTVGLTYCNDVSIEIYNDLERNVYSLYRVLSDKEMFEQFKEKCDLTYYSQDLRKEFKEKLKSNDLGILDRAFYFFYVNRTSHNGIGGFSINTVIRRNMSKSISDMLSTIDSLPELHQRLSKVVVLNEDAFKLIEKYGDREDVFMYLDPPYSQSTRGTARYTVDMDDDKHIGFIDLCLKCKAKMLISGYDCEMYDKLVENGWTKIQFDVNTTSGTHKPKTKTETLWKNY